MPLSKSMNQELKHQEKNSETAVLERNSKIKEIVFQVEESSRLSNTLCRGRNLSLLAL